MQKLKKVEDARVAMEARTSEAQEAAVPKAPTQAQQPGETTSTPAVPEV